VLRVLRLIIPSSLRPMAESGPGKQQGDVPDERPEPPPLGAAHGSPPVSPWEKVSPVSPILRKNVTVSPLPSVKKLNRYAQQLAPRKS